MVSILKTSRFSRLLRLSLPPEMGEFVPYGTSLLRDILMLLANLFPK